MSPSDNKYLISFWGLVLVIYPKHAGATLLYIENETKDVERYVLRKHHCQWTKGADTTHVGRFLEIGTIRWVCGQPGDMLTSYRC